MPPTYIPPTEENPMLSPIRVSFVVYLLAGLGLLALCLCDGLAWPARVAQAGEPIVDHQLFLPVTIKTIAPAPLPVFNGAFFVEPNTKTGSASVAVDAQGGVHLAYAYYLPDAEHPAAVYLYCPPTSDCADFASWNGVSMGDYVNEVQLALTPAGQPRLLFRATSGVYTNGNDFFYAACDQTCLDPARWSYVHVLSNSAAVFEINDRITPQRSFALDPLGRPRFVYQDYNYGIDPDHLGAYYVYCDVDCANPAPGAAQWFETRISQEINEPFNIRYEVFERASLTFTRQGQPRLVANITPIDQNQQGVYYVECDAACDEPASWARVRLYDRGSGPEATWDVELDGSDRPRLAFYEAAQLGGAGDLLHYAWCNNNCLTAAAWQRGGLSLGTLNGQGADLQLTSQGQPRLAFVNQGGSSLGYAWCDANCESAQAQWHATVLETAATLGQQYPVALPPHCQAGLWDSFAPVLALDPAGHPRVAYDSKYEAYCLYDDPNDGQPPYYRFEQVWHVVRTVLTPSP
jgi:hypothetical protein